MQSGLILVEKVSTALRDSVFSKDEANVVCKRIKLDNKENDTPTDTSVVSSNVAQSSIPAAGVQMPCFETALAPGDLTSVELITGYNLGKARTMRAWRE